MGLKKESLASEQWEKLRKELDKLGPEVGNKLRPIFEEANEVISPWLDKQASWIHRNAQSVALGLIFGLVGLAVVIGVFFNYGG